MNDTDLMRDIEADERLRDAAPKMLAALKHAQEALFWHHAEGFEIDGMTAGKRVAAAINEAEGRQ